MPPKRRRRFQGLYYHSSPPKVFSMNAKSSNSNLGKRRDVDDFSIKLSTIRIWMHEKDIGKLTRVLWAGQGNRLRQQASNNSKVKRFLAAVPHAMNSIKDVHQAVIDNNLETLQTYLEPPVPPALITCKDANGLNVLHKAAGLGHAKILEYLIGVWPDGVQETDITGKTPLHWAASCKNNMRCYTLLTEAGADEEVLDYKMKSPSYYRHKPNEIERAFLVFVPEAPRVAPDVATDWEALAEDSRDSRKIRIPEAMINGFHDRSHDNASEPDVVEGEGEKPEEGGEEEKQEKSVQGDQDVDDNDGDMEAADDKKEDDDQNQVHPQLDEDKPQEADDYKDHPVDAQVNEDDPQNDDDNPQIDKDHDHDPLVAEGESQLEDNVTNENISNDLSQATKTTTPTKTTTNMADERESEGDNNQENGDQQDLKETIQKDDDKKPIEADADENVDGEMKKQDDDDDRKNNDNDKEDVKDTVDNETHESEESTKTIEENEKSGMTNNETKSDVITESPGENNGGDEEGKKKHEDREEHETKDEELKEDTNVDSEENTEQEVKKGEEMKEKVVKEEEANKEDETKDDTDIIQKESKDESEEKRKENETKEDSSVAEEKQNGDEEKKVLLEQLTKNEKDINEDGKEEEGEEENPDSRKGKESGNEDSQVNTSKSEKKPEKLINQDEESRNDIEEEEAESITKDVDVGGHEELVAKESSELTEKTDNEKGIEKSTEPDSENPLLENEEAIVEGEQETINEGRSKTSAETGEETSDTSGKDHQMAEGSEIVHQKNEENKKRSQSALKKEKSGTQESGQSSERPQTQKMKTINGNKKSSENEKEDDERNEDRDNDGNDDVVAGSDDDDDDDDQDKKIRADVKAELWYGDVKADILADHQHEEEVDSVSVNSITSSLAIEGFVQGESEDNIVESLFAADMHEEKKDSRSIQDIIASGDMEQLAQIVLNGDGNKLLNMQSKEPEIQAFLYNVPNYMNKIRRVHVAAREGDIMGLQKALDRRKFAIAKDEISPNGASPLHVAVLFGHSDIVRYLAARFPETTTATDDDGRTALHYAATIKDNGHFYNVLTQFGANPKSVDKFGHSPEYFLDIKESNDILTYRQLLEFFGAAELEAELLSDQVPDDLHSSRRLLPDGNAAVTLDRCFNVIQESSKVLSGATASALSHRKPLSSSAVQVSVTSYLSRFLKPSVYSKIRKRQTRLDHNLFDVIWPAMRTTGMRHLEEDINCGIVAPDFDVYVVFQEFLVPLIKDMHCLSITSDFKPHPRLAYFPIENGERLNTASFVFDEESDLLHRCVVECSRNLDRFELPLNLSIGQIEQAERLMMSKIFNANFRQVIGDKESGNYYTLSEIVESDSEVRSMLANFGLMIPLLDSEDPVQAAESTAFNGSIWPYGRGVFVSVQNNLALWLNCQEHLRVIATTPASSPGDLGAAYTRVGRAVCYLERELHFRESYLLGYLQARPSYLGTGLKMCTTLRLPNLMKEMDNLRHLCSVRGLSLITKRSKNPAVRLVNMQSLDTIEYVLFQDYCTAVTNILSLEKDMSLSNSKHIATMLVKIFRRKKNSLVDRKVDTNYLEKNPVFKTEQGKYLVSTLAEPLTKALTEIAKIRPPDPVAHLATFLQKYGYTNNNNNNSRRNKNNINNNNTPSPPPPSRGKINHTSLFRPSTPTAIKSLSAGKTLTGGGGSGESGVGGGSGGERVAASNIGDVHASHNGTLQNGTLQNGTLQNGTLQNDTLQNGIKDNSNNNFDQIEEEPEAAVADGSSSPKLEDRDDHGQSMLHFASARSHRRGGLLHLIEESKIDITYRDELYRTARDVSLQANQPANAMEIDRYVLSLAAVGDVTPFEHFGAAGYDHIIDVVSTEGDNIIDVAVSRGHDDLVNFLQNLRPLEEQREELHEAIRENKIDRVVELTAGSNGKWLICAKNYYGRTALHIAVLKESEEIVEHLVNMCPQALKIGDNLERSALHYAMGTNAVETISRMLIQKGARRTSKDLKGRQPSYYFINKADILRLQEEEDESR